MNDKQLSGLKKFESFNPEGLDKIRSLLEDTAPGIYHQILEIAFGDLYQRTNLDLKIRQMVSLVSLAAAGHDIELRFTCKLQRRSGSRRKSWSKFFHKWFLLRAFRHRCWASVY
jgi:alkylhydroperoxidase/carboxymuconolactone decarboxylase family protein YurZ